MFNNLIESSSHTREYKRRGSFLLFTTGIYAVLLVLGGVASIYAYDARLEEQSLEIVTLLPPVEVVPAQPEVSRPNQPRETSRNDSEVPQRATAMLSVNHPEVVPTGVSTAPNKNLPLPETGPVSFGPEDRGAGPTGGPGVTGGGGRVVVPPAQIITLPDQPPPPPADPPKQPKVISKGPITGLAIYLPKPNYSEIAKRARIQGQVSVQVLIDEQGRVLSAKVVGGHPLLTVDAQRAALQARFSPTKLGDQPVRVSGVITYNFVLSN